MELYVIYTLLAVVVLQQIFFIHQINKLVDKIMSGSFQGYVKALNPDSKELKIKIDDEPREDLSVLHDFS